MYVKNCWYVAAWNYEVTGKALFKCSIINQPIVIYVKDDGQYVAMEDRCCHRALPLSMGRLEGNDLRCMYHGLKFAPTGQCVEMPGQDRIPPGACVRTFPVVEAHSWVWVWMGDPDKADRELIPECIALETPGLQHRSGHIEYDADYQLINDNLLDFSHLGYVHSASFGTSEDWAYTRPKIVRLERGVRVQRWVTNQASRIAGPENKVDIWGTYDYMLPGVMIMNMRVTPAGSAQLNNMEPPDLTKTATLFSQFSCQAVTPISDTRSRYSFSVLTSDEDAERGLLDAFWANTRQAFDEDRAVIEAQAKSMAMDPARKLIPSVYDSALGQFRWMIEKQAREESSASADGVPG
ncbi:aromatic ring-hydroxylating dioxygenase subunit alpha [Noviherbaspirillum saxi]|uniref:Aromatic ring-hydroxylating dioxygenase subunit alpha n=1 Tax=Noviherbaspirillum saxi TaxID=2320863 RepID=A0A3A3FG02_9BURK|nr:aromatic ring-hydroxylating dioxygenase subunit alpha [Noviherbaspirillum saxi]RJF92291.1 aromatic ring-hydroxylating dioxygenase subunit alpha [Noviherbaspirillum saxi]